MSQCFKKFVVTALMLLIAVPVFAQSNRDNTFKVDPLITPIKDPLFLQGLARLCIASSYLPAYSTMGFIPQWDGSNASVNVHLASQACFQHVMSGGSNEIAQDFAIQTVGMLLAIGKFSLYFTDEHYAYFNEFLESHSSKSSNGAQAAYFHSVNAFEYNNRFLGDVSDPYPILNFQEEPEWYLKIALKLNHPYAINEVLKNKEKYPEYSPYELILKIIDTDVTWLKMRWLVDVDDFDEELTAASLEDEEFFAKYVGALRNIGFQQELGSFFAFRKAAKLYRSKKDFKNATISGSFAYLSLLYSEKYLNYKNRYDIASIYDYEIESIDENVRMDAYLGIVEDILLDSYEEGSDSAFHLKTARNILLSGSGVWDEKLTQKQADKSFAITAQIHMFEAVPYLYDPKKAHFYCFTASNVCGGGEFYKKIVAAIEKIEGVEYFTRAQELYESDHTQLASSELLDLGKALLLYANYDEAELHLRNAINMGNAEAGYYLANKVYAFDFTIPEDSDAYNIMETAAEMGSLKAIEAMINYWGERYTPGWQIQNEKWQKIGLERNLQNAYLDNFLDPSVWKPPPDGELFMEKHLGKLIDIAESRKRYSGRAFTVLGRIYETRFVLSQDPADYQKAVDYYENNFSFSYEWKHKLMMKLDPTIEKIGLLEDISVFSKEAKELASEMMIDLLECVASELNYWCAMSLGNMVSGFNSILAENFFLLGHFKGDLTASSHLIRKAINSNGDPDLMRIASNVVKDMDESVFRSHATHYTNNRLYNPDELTLYARIRAFWEKANFNFIRSKVFENLQQQEFEYPALSDINSFYDSVLTGDKKLISKLSKKVAQKTKEENAHDYFSMKLADRFYSISDPDVYISSSPTSLESLLVRLEKIKDSKNTSVISQTNLQIIENSLTNIAFASSIVGDCENTRRVIREIFENIPVGYSPGVVIRKKQEGQIEKQLFSLYALGLCNFASDEEIILARELMGQYSIKQDFSGIKLSELYLISQQLKNKGLNTDSQYFLTYAWSLIEKFRRSSLLDETSSNANQEMLIRTVLNAHLNESFKNAIPTTNTRLGVASLLKYFELSSRPTVDKALNAQLLSFALQQEQEKIDANEKINIKNLFDERTKLNLKIRDLEQRVSESMESVFEQNTLINQLDAINNEIEPLMKDIFIPGYSSGFRSGDHLKSLQVALEKNELLVGIVLTESETYRIEVDKTNASWFKEPIGRNELLNKIRALERLTELSDVQNIETKENDFLALLKGLSPIFRPDEIKNGQQIIYVVPPDLLNFPFSTLLTGSFDLEIDHASKKIAQLNGFLGQQVGIKLAPSLTSILTTRDIYYPWEDKIIPSIYKEFSGNKKKTGGVLALGNPSFRNKEATLNKTLLAKYRSPDTNQIESIASLSPLPETEDEVKTIANLFPASKILLGVEANEKNYLELAKEKFKYIVFATHSLNVGELINSDYSGLALTPNEHSDGLLTALEIATSPIQAELVSLAACSTAAASKLGRDAFSGVVEGFIRAGARSVLYTLWPVFSKTTKEINISVFENMQNGQSPDLALSKSINEYLDSDLEAWEYNPLVWGAYGLIGY